MFIDAYFQTATHLFDEFALQMPLHLYLKEYFRNNKKFGSRDRKIISELLYGMYRLGSANKELELRDRFIIGSFLSGRLPLLFFQKVNPELAALYTASFDEKMDIIQKKYDYEFTVPFTLSGSISEADFVKNLFSQPRVFIRIRKNKKQIEEIFYNNKIEYVRVDETCFSFESNIKLDEYLDEADYVIQDYASQKTIKYLAPKPREKWWDCCAASGGKSILLLDTCPSIDLTTSDIRESTLKNLHTRMQVCGYGSQYIAYVLDVSSDVSDKIKQKFDVVLCDAPCSGSGTWARTPEQYYFFTQEKLNEFTKLQFKILSNVSSYVKPNGRLYYITCSIIEDENELLVKKFKTEHPSCTITSHIIDASKYGGDKMFVAEISTSVL